MISDTELYENMHNRYSSVVFKQDVVPTKEIINKILEESLLLTPVFSNLWHHRVDVYGPEYAEDKRDVCIQTVEHLGFREMFDKRKQGKAGIEVLHNELEKFEEAIKTGAVRKDGFSIFDDPVPFNTQVLAPYLLKFTPEAYTFGEVKQEEVHATSGDWQGQKLKAIQSAMAQAMAIAVVARKYAVDSSFCGCFIINDENKNRIWYNDDTLIKFVGLGYKDDNCYDGPGSKHGDLKQRPDLNSNVVRWK